MSQWTFFFFFQDSKLQIRLSDFAKQNVSVLIHKKISENDQKQVLQVTIPGR